MIQGDFQAPNWLDLQRLHHNRVNELSARGFDLRLVCVSPYRPRHVAKPHFKA